MPEIGVVADVDLARLRAAVQNEYAVVANQPGKGFHFHTGRPLAKLLGYSDEWLEGIPESAAESLAGTGNPFFTTDSAAALRAIEIGADVLLKATKVDGVYDKDPNQHDDAERFESISYREAIARDLKIMDTSAFSLCMDHDIPIVVFNLKAPGHIAEVVAGARHGTLITRD